MKRLILIITFSAIAASTQAMAACGSGPDFCKDDPRIAELLAEKKARLAKDFPAELIALLDRGSMCVARIKQSPDIFTIKEVKANGEWQTVPLDSDAFRISKERLTKGEISHFWLLHASRAFACDGDGPHDQRDDWIAAEEVNSDLAIRCGDCMLKFPGDAS